MGRHGPRRAWLAWVRRTFVTSRTARVAAVVRGGAAAPPAAAEGGEPAPAATAVARRRATARAKTPMSPGQVGAILAIAVVYLLAVFGTFFGVLASCG